MTDSDPSRSVDVATLRYLGRAFGRRDEVRQTSLFPSNKPESLVVTLDAEYYPEPVDGVSLDVRAYTNGEFHVSYHETRAGDRRRCRWDRHDQPHNARDHFHPLPDAATDAAVDRDYVTDLTRVVEQTILPWVDERVGALWESTPD
ncbi:hypothetical protein DVK05_12640 [Halorubrum sp. Atlit-8R]|uniref:hypothetical protein n=1 Tax=unclassified Halorubrum TaxID=2642239 RepID=UPI000EF1E108|nr:MULTISPECIES: hypothetical protein [unclassified Halorubrum]RLM67564.1 hypothetical protein DVK08_12715 [Halorubrum sp. Atlit-9R]RLM77722.1 hypothetical protein DVK05_12640 [Halorubrum sp. Atlit-8R]